jgi:STAS-like domain of unknown function (DUF4325)
MTTFAPCGQMRLADRYGEILGGRVLGDELRAEILMHVQAGEEVVVDFEGVVAMSPSFADEVFGKLPAAVAEHVEFANVSADLQAVADMVRAGRPENGNGTAAK